MIGNNVPHQKVPADAAAKSVACLIDEETNCGIAAEKMAFEAIRRTRDRGLIKIVTGNKGVN